MEIYVENIPPEPVKPVKLFHLTMTEEEVEILWLLSTSINGFNQTGLRQNTDKWFHILAKCLGAGDNEQYNVINRLRSKYKIDPKCEHLRITD